MARSGKRGRRTQQEVVLYKQVEEVVQTVIKRIDGLQHLEVQIAPDGKVKFKYRIQAEAIEDSGEL